MNNEIPFDADAVQGEIERRSSEDFLFFVRSLVIPSASGPKMLEDAMSEYERRGIEPFQRRFFEDVAPSLRAVRTGEMPPCRRFWVERTKKASKDSDLAVCLLWLMAFPKRPLFCQVVAADRDQAGIIKHRAEDILFYNEWLRERVRVPANKIVSVDGLGKAVIEATDKASAHGETPSLLVLNELVHVSKWEVMETHYNNAAGVPRGVLIVSTNAGYQGTKADVWKKNALSKRGRWNLHVWNEQAPWLDEEDVEDARSVNTPSEFARLFRGRWISVKGDALTEETIDAVFRPYLEPMTGKEEDWKFVAGLDLGRSHDHSGLTVVGANEGEKRIRVAWMRDWKPTVPNSRGVLQVDVEAVKREIVRVNEQYAPVWFGYDPAEGAWQWEQEMRTLGILLHEMPFTGATLNEMAAAFMKAVPRLECYESPILRRDLGKFSMVPRPPNRYRLEAMRDEYGHADVGTALLICLPKAVELVGRLTIEVSQVFFHDLEGEGGASDDERELEKGRGRDPFLDDMLKGAEEGEEERRWRDARRSSVADMDFSDFL